MKKLEDVSDQYFEGILQLRDPNDEVVAYIHELFEDPRVWISQEKHVRGGIDFYVSSQRFLRGLGTKLQMKFGGEIKNSRKIHTRDKNTQKDLYRAFLMFRPSKYKKGDIITHRGDKIQIISAQKEIFGKDVKTGKKVHIKFDKL